MSNYNIKNQNNQVLYIIHGWTYTTKPWAKTIDLLEKAGFKIKMLHVPGLTEPSRKVWTIDEYVKWADQSIPDGAIALGHSNGGRILLNLCILKPDKLRHLILLNSAGVYEASSRRDRLKRLAHLFAPLKKIKILRKVFHKILGASDYSQAPANMKQTLTNMLESDKNLKLEQVSVPTTIVWGESDTITPLRQGQLMQKKITNSKLLTRKNWRHAPYIQDAAGLASTISSILKGLR